jgi:mRNA interferase MazF
MPSTTTYRRGDVVLVPFPFTDLSSAKQQPALVVSADAFNLTREDVLVAAITSQVPAQRAADEFMIPPDELAACGLPKPTHFGPDFSSQRTDARTLRRTVL